MPIEIKELIIRAVVQSDGAQEPAGSTGGSGTAAADREAIVAAAVREVLRIIKDTKER
jgi:hypothetical protein